MHLSTHRQSNASHHLRYHTNIALQGRTQKIYWGKKIELQKFQSFVNIDVYFEKNISRNTTVSSKIQKQLSSDKKPKKVILTPVESQIKLLFWKFFKCSEFLHFYAPTIRKHKKGYVQMRGHMRWWLSLIHCNGKLKSQNSRKRSNHWNYNSLTCNCLTLAFFAWLK